MSNYIYSSCVISNGCVFKNSEKIFSGEQSELKPLFESIYQFAESGYPKFYKMDNLSKLGFLATEILLKDQPWVKMTSPDDVGIVLSNASASLDTDIKYYKTVQDFPSPSLFVYTLPNIVIGEISIRHGFKGENAFFISADFDPAFLVRYVDNLINSNILQYCICGWTELMGDRYKAALFLVGKVEPGHSADLFFDAKNIIEIYESDNR